MMKRFTSEKLGEILLKREIITEQQLKEAIKIHQETGKMIGQVLLELGYANEEAVARVLTTEYRFPYLPLDNYEIDSSVTSIVPRKLAEKYNFIPIDKMGDTLTISIANPLDEQALEDIKKITNCDVQIFISTLSQIRDVIRNSYPENTD